MVSALVILPITVASHTCTSRNPIHQTLNPFEVHETLIFSNGLKPVAIHHSPLTIRDSPLTTYNFLILIFRYQSLPFSVPWKEICPFLKVPNPGHSANFVFFIM